MSVEFREMTKSPRLGCSEFWQISINFDSKIGVMLMSFKLGLLLSKLRSPIVKDLPSFSFGYIFLNILSRMEEASLQAFETSIKELVLLAKSKT